MDIDKIDRKLLNVIQSDFPVEKEPYKKLAEMLGIKEKEVLSRVSKMIEKDIVRRLGGVFNSRKLGYTGKEEINSILEEIKSLTGEKEIINLPSKRLFKIKVNFRMPEDDNGQNL